MIDEHWVRPAEEKPDGWHKLGNTFHLHMRDMLHCLEPEMILLWVYGFTTTSKANVNMCIILYWVHFITLHLVFFVYLKMLWEFHWTCFSLSFCFHVALFLKKLHAMYCFWCEIYFSWEKILITLHAVLKCSLSKFKAVWINECVFVFVKGLSYSIMCTLWWEWVVKKKKNAVWFYVA